MVQNALFHTHILTGGESPLENQLLSHLSFLPPPSCIIAADSGLDTARRYGITPNVILGDMDSVSSKDILTSYNSNDVIMCKTDKDYTDTELAILEAKKRAKEKTIITMTGADGGRIDHLLAVRSLYDKNNAPHIWICKTQAIYFLPVHTCIKITDISVDDYISVFPVISLMKEEHYFITSDCLAWPLQHVLWEKGDISISNKISTQAYNNNGKILTLHTVSSSFILIVPLTVRIIFYAIPLN